MAARGPCTGCPAVADASTSGTPRSRAGISSSASGCFFIIALGETVLTTATAFTDEPFELERLLALAIGFTGTVALWWCYFQCLERIGVEAAATAEDAGAVGW
jgi:low temperature requirement protein LtrA